MGRGCIIQIIIPSIGKEGLATFPAEALIRLSKAEIEEEAFGLTNSFAITLYKASDFRDAAAQTLLGQPNGNGHQIPSDENQWIRFPRGNVSWGVRPFLGVDWRALYVEMRTGVTIVSLALRARRFSYQGGIKDPIVTHIPFTLVPGGVASSPAHSCNSNTQEAVDHAREILEQLEG